MNEKFSFSIVVLIVSLGFIYMFYQSQQMEKKEILEDKQREVIQLLQDDLEKFDPILESFVDRNYRSVLASEVNSNGICKFDRALAKNQDPFGNYIVEFDLINMKVISKKLKISNYKYIEEWETFKEKY